MPSDRATYNSWLNGSAGLLAQRRARTLLRDPNFDPNTLAETYEDLNKARTQSALRAMGTASQKHAELKGLEATAGQEAKRKQAEAERAHSLGSYRQARILQIEADGLQEDFEARRAAMTKEIRTLVTSASETIALNKTEMARDGEWFDRHRPELSRGEEKAVQEFVKKVASEENVNDAFAELELARLQMVALAGFDSTVGA